MAPDPQGRELSPWPRPPAGAQLHRCDAPRAGVPGPPSSWLPGEAAPGELRAPLGPVWASWRCKQFLPTVYAAGRCCSCSRCPDGGRGLPAGPAPSSGPLGVGAEALAGPLGPDAHCPPSRTSEAPVTGANWGPQPPPELGLWLGHHLGATLPPWAAAAPGRGRGAHRGFRSHAW